MIINGGVKGIYNIPSTASASGVWSRFDQNINKSLGRWPIAAGNTATPVVATAMSNSPYLKIARFFPGSGFGTVYSDPGTIPGGPSNDIQFSPDNNAVVVADNSSNPGRIRVYSWSGAGFGSLLQTFSLSVSNYAKNVQISPNGKFIAIKNYASSYSTVLIYNFNSITGIGTLIGSSTILYDSISYTTLGRDTMRWSPANDSIVWGVYGSSSGVGNLYGATVNPATGVLGTSTLLANIGGSSFPEAFADASFHPTGAALATSFFEGGFAVYNYTLNPSISVSSQYYYSGGITGYLYGISFSRDGTFLVTSGFAAGSSPSGMWAVNSANGNVGSLISNMTNIASNSYFYYQITASYSSTDIIYNDNISGGLGGYPVTRSGSSPTGIGSAYTSLALISGANTQNIVTNNYNY